LIDFHPDYASVLFATGGSGHAYKVSRLSYKHGKKLYVSQFLPILGRLVVDRLEGKLENPLAKRFAFGREFNIGNFSDLTRSTETPKELDISQLCTSEDLLPV
jgi:sarcosine oxidase / L-pipecolate oxidase